VPEWEDMTVKEDPVGFDLMNHDERIDFVRRVFPAIGKYCHQNLQYYLDIWQIAEDAGLNIVITDYNSPVVFKDEIAKAARGEYIIDPALLGFDIEEQKQAFLPLASYQDELLGIPFESGDSNVFGWLNGMFPIGDAYLYYALIRDRRPRRIIEIGSGQSTLVALKALNRNQSGRITCVEPYPNQHFNTHLSRMAESNFELIAEQLQNIPADFFQSLQENDILFVDSSHVVKSQSDLMHLFFKVIPTLAKGVLIHFHDIFLPYDYPTEFMVRHKRFYTEQYVLAGMLMNNQNFKTLFSNFYFAHQAFDFYAQQMRSLLSDIEKSSPPETPIRAYVHGGSLWMTTRDGSENERFGNRG